MSDKKIPFLRRGRGFLLICPKETRDGMWLMGWGVSSLNCAVTSKKKQGTIVRFSAFL